jgi:hypothetical protein
MVLTVTDLGVTTITGFRNPAPFPAFALPTTLNTPARPLGHRHGA